MTESRGISVPSTAILDAASLNTRAPSIARIFTVTVVFYFKKLQFFYDVCPHRPNNTYSEVLPRPSRQGMCQVSGNTGRSPALHDYRVAELRLRLRLVLGVFAGPACVDWTEEQRLRFTDRRTYRKKTVSSPTPEPDNRIQQLIVPSQQSPRPGPSTSPEAVDIIPVMLVPHQSSLESLLVGLTTHLASLSATLRGARQEGGVGG